MSARSGPTPLRYSMGLDNMLGSEAIENIYAKIRGKDELVWDVSALLND